MGFLSHAFAQNKYFYEQYDWGNIESAQDIIILQKDSLEIFLGGEVYNINTMDRNAYLLEINEFGEWVQVENHYYEGDWSNYKKLLSNNENIIAFGPNGLDDNTGLGIMAFINTETLLIDEFKVINENIELLVGAFTENEEYVLGGYIFHPDDTPSYWQPYIIKLDIDEIRLPSLKPSKLESLLE